MSVLVIEGLAPLKGKTKIYGAKNSILPILAATIVVSGVSVIHNCPHLSDVNSAIEILESLGCTVTRQKHTITVDSTNCNSYEISEKMMSKMRSSILFLGSILARFNKAILHPPGGCDLGPRPINLHLMALGSMGAKIECIGNRLECSSPKGLTNCDFTMPFPSVGATENMIIASCISKGKTIIKNFAKEPEIVDLIDFLNGAGANITYNDSTIEIVGVQKLNSSSHTVITDRIAVATIACASCITGGEVEIEDLDISTLVSVKETLEKMGCNFNKNKISNNYTPLKGGLTIKSAPYPGFPTDAIALMVSLSCVCEGKTVIEEKVFKNRFNHIKYLKQMGANINVENNIANIVGVKQLTGKTVKAQDLRGGAGLVLAGLSAKGTTIVENIEHIDRGYAKIEEQLESLGAKIKRV